MKINFLSGLGKHDFTLIRMQISFLNWKMKKKKKTFSVLDKAIAKLLEEK